MSHDPDLPDDDDDDASIDPLERLLSMEPSPAAVGPDGGFRPTKVGYQLATIPAATPDTLVCLRDCRHYFEAKAGFASGNAQGTPGLEHDPVQIMRYCMRMPRELELTDEVIYSCSSWDPLAPEEKRPHAERRATWLAANPQWGKDQR